MPPRSYRAFLLVLIAVMALGGLRTAAVGAAEKRPTLAIGAYSSGAPDWGPSLDGMAQKMGRNPALVMWFRDFTTLPFVTEDLNRVAAIGAAPVITWEPWNSSTKDGTGYSMSAIRSGALDGYLRDAARQAAAWKKRIYVRLAHEMNGGWTVWGKKTTSPADFVAAWRRTVAIFRQEGATNVSWIWSPNVDDGGLPFDAWFPGDAWIDWVGMDGYNWGDVPGKGGPRTPMQLFATSYARLAALSAKPLMIAETASTEGGTSKANWITSLRTMLVKSMPRVQALIWFDKPAEGADWALDSTTASLSAFRSMAQDPTFAASAGTIAGRAPARAATTRPGRKLQRRTAA